MWTFLTKLKTELPYGLAVQLLCGVYAEKMKVLIKKDACSPASMAALSAATKARKQTHAPDR